MTGETYRMSTTNHIMRLFLLTILLSTISAAPVVRVKDCPAVLPTDATPRIVGGNEASPRTRSHVVSFYEEGCGGSLLSDVWVLTAAHCLVHDGSMARISGANSSNGVEIPVKRVIDHPDYEFPTNDITLVELESPAPSSASFMTVNSNPSIPEDGEYARVAGYGFQEEGFDVDHDAMLRQVDVPVMNTQKCIDRYFSVNSYLRESISPTNHICAGYDTGGCDSCTADSGGPLFVYDSQNTPVQIAIVSFGYGCAREVPGGYTRVSTYVPWMKSVGAVFEEKTARVARFGDSVIEAEGDDFEPEKHEEETDATSAEALPEQAIVPSPSHTSEAVSSSVPLPLDPGTSAATPDETEFVEAPSSLSPSPKPSPPSRLPPHHAVSPPPSEDKPSISAPQGGHGGEGNPRPVTDGSNSEEPVFTGEDEESGTTVSTDEQDSDVSPIDASPSDASPSDASPSDAGPGDASPSAASPSAASPSAAAAAEAEEDEPEEFESNPPSSEDDDAGSNDDTPGEGETSNSNDRVPSGNVAGPTIPESNPNIHRPAPPNPESEPEGEDEQHDQSENSTASEDENSNQSSSGGSEIGSGEIIEGEIDNGSANESDDHSESGSNEGESQTNGIVEVPSAGEIESGPEIGVGPIDSPGPSSGSVVPPSESMTGGFEELEPSGSPEVTESPEALDSDSEFDAEGGGLGSLPIALIVIASVVTLAIVGYFIYHMANRREQ